MPAPADDRQQSARARRALLGDEENGRWSPGVKVADGVQNARTRYPTWNPVLFQPRSGPLMLFYKVGPSPREWWGMLMTSTDDGRGPRAAGGAAP